MMGNNDYADDNNNNNNNNEGAYEAPFSENEGRDGDSNYARSPNARDRNYVNTNDSINEDGIDASAAKMHFRRSESVNRPMNRTLSGDPGFRNTTIEAKRATEPRGNSVDNSQFARFMRLHKSLNLKQSNISRSKINSVGVSFTPKEQMKASFYAHNNPSVSDKQMINNKLAYEWKNIFRNILSVNSDNNSRQKLGSSDFVTLRDFDEVCQKFRVNFTKEELAKIQKLFAANSSSKNVVGEGAQFSLRGVINFVSISHLMGLHRDSYNHMGSHSLANQRSRSIFKLKQLYNSIEPVEEEQHNTNGEGENDYNA